MTEPLSYPEILETVLSLPRNYRTVIYLYYYQGYRETEMDLVTGYISYRLRLFLWRATHRSNYRLPDLIKWLLWRRMMNRENNGVKSKIHGISVTRISYNLCWKWKNGAWLSIVKILMSKNLWKYEGVYKGKRTNSISYDSTYKTTKRSKKR